MLLLRLSVGRNVPRASDPAMRRFPMAFARYESRITSGTPVTQFDKPHLAHQSGQSSTVNYSVPGQSQIRYNQPDYCAEVDQASSNFTPVPKRVMNGSEEGHVVPAAVLSGAPVELQGRIVRIYRPAKTATQSGDWHSHHWRMDWDILSKGHRWENPLIGWQSSADIMQGTHVNFKSKEDAINFVEKQGYEYFVQEPNERKFVPKAYAKNFLYTPGKLKHIRTK